MALKSLDLFSGIGGFALGFSWAGIETVAFCEIDPFCRNILHKNFPNTPIHEDIRGLDGTQYRGTVDIVCGGFPCQPFSVAGKRRGKEDDRHLWPEMLRIIKECQPTWVIGENVAGFISMGLDDVCADLESEGYEVQPVVIPACALSAPHRRDRVWIIANRYGSICYPKDGAGTNIKESKGEVQIGVKPSRTSAAFPNAQYPGLDAPPGAKKQWNGSSASGWWGVEPTVGRMANGLPDRVDRLKGLGNAVVPQIPYIIGSVITKGTISLISQHHLTQ